jgi:hypothetical protein
MSQNVNESLNMQGYARVLDLPAPGSANEPARLADLTAAVAVLNAALAGFDFIEEPARLASTVNINVASAPTQIDGTNANVNDLIFLTGQATNTQNGLYTYNGVAEPMTRAVDPVTDAAFVFQAGSVVSVGPDGASNKNTLWLETTDNPVVGTSALTFTEFGSSLTNGTGLTIAGNVISLATPVAVGNGGTNATTPAAARASLGTPGVFRATFGDGASSSFAINHALGSQFCHVQIWNTVTLAREDCAAVATDANHVQLSAEAWTGAPPGAGAYEVVIVG